MMYEIWYVIYDMDWYGKSLSNTLRLALRIIDPFLNSKSSRITKRFRYNTKNGGTHLYNKLYVRENLPPK